MFCGYGSHFFGPHRRKNLLPLFRLTSIFLFWKDSWWSISHLSGDVTFPPFQGSNRWNPICAPWTPTWIPMSTGGIAISCSWMTQRLSGHSKAASISSSTAASGKSLRVADSLHVFNCFSCIGYKRFWGGLPIHWIPSSDYTSCINKIKRISL